jgi:hypothetical protein
MAGTGSVMIVGLGIGLVWLLAGLVCVAVCWYQSGRPVSEIDRFCAHVDRWVD